MYALIIVGYMLGIGTGMAPVNVDAEFHTLDSCNTARTRIVGEMTASGKVVILVSNGCHKK